MSTKEKVRLKSLCPVKGCNNQDVIDWIHSACSRDDYIDEEANIICNGPYSSCSPRFFFQTTFNCGHHTTSERAEGSEQQLTTKLSMLGMNKYGGGRRFFLKVMDKLLEYIEKHEEDFK
jgi:hypothetical protein